MKKYLIIFLISMVPIIELRGAMVYAEGYDLNPYISLLICVIGNMIPVPFVYFFARRILEWGAKKRFIGKVFRFFLEKGEKAGNKLAKTSGKYGLFISMLLFVGIPIPGTGAWTGTLGASFLKMGFRKTVLAVCLGVIMAGIIMALASMGVFSFLK